MGWDFPTGREEKRAVLLDAVREISGTVASLAGEAEEAGTLPMPMVKAIQDKGLFTLKMPAAVGGAEADPVTQMEVIEAMAYIYPAAAWVMMINSTAIGTMGAYLPDEAIKEIYAGGYVPRAATVGAPTGTAIPVAGGYRLSGRWSFVSGVPHSEWITAGALIKRDTAAAPEERRFVIRTADCVIHDNWQVAGLKGSGSNDVSASDVFVPEAFTWPVGERLRAPIKRGGPFYLITGPAFVTYEHIGWAIGVTRRALDTLVQETQSKRRGRGAAAVTLADRHVFQRFVGESNLKLRAARAIGFEVYERAWETVCGGEPTSLAQEAEMRAAATYAQDVGAELTTKAFRYGGGAALHLSSVLQQCMRDMQAGAQHFIVNDTSYEALGQALIGQAEGASYFP